jgi:glycine dehydrogenase
MLDDVRATSLEALIDEIVPRAIRLSTPLDIEAETEAAYLQRLRGIAARNRVCRTYIGLGYHDTHTPAVITRNVFENPGWYTPYTPYQAEIAQGRLESLLNFQTMVEDLTGMPIANASLLDEATAAAEAMALLARVHKREGPSTFVVSPRVFPQVRALLETRAAPLGIALRFEDPRTTDLGGDVFGVYVQTPDDHGALVDVGPIARRAHEAGALIAVGTDLLALTLVAPPGEAGADVVVGSAQRFGVPLGYGGPHAAFFATREAYVRQAPGRLVGVSVDAHGRRAYRMALQTREQHIRREKATSNICTAQALLANMAAMYGVFHGPAGLAAIAARVHRQTLAIAGAATAYGWTQENAAYFDTIRLHAEERAVVAAKAAAERQGVNLRYPEKGVIQLSLNETVSEADLEDLLQILAPGAPPTALRGPGPARALPEALVRRSAFMTHPVFNRHHSETEMMRYIRSLERKDLGLDSAMIPLGSCTMKLNAAAEMMPVGWPEFARLHPFAPTEQAAGYRQVFEELEGALAAITGFRAVSLQPNSGAQGEFAGLLVIRAYHHARGEHHRDVVLIPQSAHGTNPASATMAGMHVVVVSTDATGNIDVSDLRAKAQANRERLSCLMVTYPSTHGVFEETIREICQVVHDQGGQVYMDGANMNAQVGLTSPGFIGADVCHLNLHKTFCIPHGGGGPGVGPIGVAKHLIHFLPGHPQFMARLDDEHSKQHIGPVSAAPWGSASILPISWMYIAMMGPDGLTEATKYAILNANYISKRLKNHFPTLYRSNGLVAHECILDLRMFHKVTAEDVAKRLMDYGFHAPTLSFPVAGTLMVEPTESESKYELDRFCDAMISIHAEMTAVENGTVDAKNNLLKNAPHTADQIASDTWNRPYSREQAAFPAKSLHDYKFWPHVSRVDNVFGDRNPVCSCVGMENYSA